MKFKGSVKALMVLSALLILCSGALAATYGTLKVLVPLHDCRVYIDGLRLDPDENKVVSTRLSTGTHRVSVRLREETPILETDVDVREGETTIINVANELKNAMETPSYSGASGGTSGGGGGAAPAQTVSSTQQQQRVAYTPGKQGSKFGLSIGFLGAWAAVLDVGAFYSDDIGKDLRYEIVADYWLFTANVGLWSVSILPLQANIKYKLDENLTLGGGLNYALWNIAELSVNPGIGYQLQLEIKSISSEIGYIVASGTMSFAETGWSYSTAFATGGVYYKYKFYF